MVRMIDACPVCASSDRELVLSLPGVPVLVNAQVRPNAAQAVPRGDIDLSVCHHCGHLYNASFDETLIGYDAAYENTLHFSAQFRSFARQLAADLVDRHHLAGARVAEFGSGPGHFLSLLCEAGVAEGFGWDPSYDPHRLGAPEHPGVTISTDSFPSDGSFVADLALSQHVLEHLADPVAALRAQRLATPRGQVYSEVPNGDLIIDHCAVWDVIYEHLSYFVDTSLDLSCRRADLTVNEMGTSFGDQFLWCTASPSGDPAAEQAAPDERGVAAVVERARAFGIESRGRIEAARRAFAVWRDRGPVALWGAGSKGVTYLNLVDGTGELACVVDINPRKAGWGIPGTSNVVCTPDELIAVAPRTVVVANPMYAEEISASLQTLGVDADVQLMWE